MYGVEGLGQLTRRCLSIISSRAVSEEIDGSLRAQTTKSSLFCEMRVMS